MGTDNSMVTARGKCRCRRRERGTNGDGRSGKHRIQYTDDVL